MVSLFRARLNSFNFFATSIQTVRVFSLAKHKDWKKGGNGYPSSVKSKNNTITLIMALFQFHVPLTYASEPAQYWHGYTLIECSQY